MNFSLYSYEGGFYSNKMLLKFTKKPNSFPLPDDYEVITVWKKQSNTVKYSIRYENFKSFFRVYYDNNFEQVLEIIRSCTAVATQIQKASYLKICNKVVYFYSINILINIIYV